MESSPAQRLLEWFGHRARDLPWRRNRTPYRVLVAEFMLQQTRSETVISYYERFLERFPTLEALAQAELEEVLRVWEGLGYYARARNLHALAHRVVEEFNGQIPATYRELRALPGVGPYTAAAVASIAFSQPEIALDGNVRRVLARVLALSGDGRQPEFRRTLEETARRWMPPDRPGPFNEALMELGATVCLPRRPRCSECPLQEDCRAHQMGQEEEFPRPSRRPQVPHYDVTAAVIRDSSGRVLLARRKETGFLGGLWEFPGGKREEGETLPECLARELREELGIEVEVGEHLLTLRHAYTHFRVTLHVFACRIRSGTPRCLDCADVRWAEVSELNRFPMPATDRRIARFLEGSVGFEPKGREERREGINN